MAGLRSEVESKMTGLGSSTHYAYDGSDRTGSDPRSSSHPDLWSSKPSSHPGLWSPDELRDNKLIRTTTRAHKVGSIPGYSGFIPGKVAENVIRTSYEATVRECRQLTEANTIRHQELMNQSKRDEPSIDVGPEAKDIAGVSTFLSRRLPEHQCKRPLSTVLAVTDMKYSTGYGEGKGLPSDRTILKDHCVPDKEKNERSRPGEEIPGYSGFLPASIRPREPAVHRDLRDLTEAVPAGVATEAAAASVRNKPAGIVTNVYRNSVLGYSGFVPGKTSENVVGVGYTRGTEQALDSREYLRNKIAEITQKNM